MGTIRLILTIIYIIDCIFLTVIVLMQEGKQQGLGALSGSNDSYYSKIKGRSKEGTMVKISTAAAILFLLLSVVLNLKMI